MRKKYLIIILLIGLILFFAPTMVNAVDKYTATSTINGVTVNWEYELNESNEIINLKCTNATALTGNITIPNFLDGKTVVSLGDEAFKSAKNITGVTVSNSIQTIGYGAFNGCASLTNVDLGNITKLSFDVFKGCTSLTSITIPKTLKNGAISPCLNNPNITSITLEEGLTVVPSYLCANTGISSIKIPSSVTSIDYDAFSNCTNLKDVDLGKISKISFDVFKNCPKLTNISIPKTLIEGTTVDTGVFTGTTNLTSVTFEDGLKEIPAGILQKCSGITAVTIPETVEKINCYAFSGTSITEINIPNSVKEIDYYAFKDCDKLNKATILDNCANIGWFILYPTQDTVFNNHNDNLTIYCYEGSKIAEYAIGAKIKYVYLTKPASDIPVSEDKKTDSKSDSSTSSTETKDSKETSTTVTPKVDSEETSAKEDKTTASSVLPKTGAGLGLIISIIAVLGIGTFAFVKFRNYKGI